MTLPIEPGQVVGSWEISREYMIRDGQLFSIGGPDRGYYRPQERDELPFEIAKLATGTDADIVRFAQRWGTLGYLQLREARRVRARLAVGFDVELPEEPHFEGERVGWIRREARRLALCVSLADGLTCSDESKVAGAVSRFFALEREEGEWATSMLAWENIFRFQFFLGEKEPLRHPVEPALADRPLEVGRFMLDHLVNSGIDGLTPYLELTPYPDFPNVPAILFRFGAMVQIAYLHIARLLVDRSQIAYCEECGKPFKKTDGRQRFCAKGPFSTESPCSYRFRYKKFKSRRSTNEQER